jgi:hypothetical protein
VKRAVVCGAVLALGLSGTGLAQAQAPSGYKVNGGGQAFPTADDVSGAGDTLGFTAQQTAGEDDAAARGQVQYVDREGGRQVANVHGTVTCLVVDGQQATIGGVLTRGGSEDGGFFQLDVMDSGQENRGTDVVMFREVDEEPACDEPGDLEEAPVLARGNVTIHEPRG